MKLLEENIEEHFHNFGIDKDFLGHKDTNHKRKDVLK